MVFYVKRIVLAIILIIAAFVLQSTVFKWLSIGNASPNLIVLVVFLLSFIGGTRTGIFVGFFTGLIIDCFYGDIFGANALIFLFLGYFNGLFGKMFYDDDIKLPIILLVASDLAYNFIFYAIWLLFNGSLNVGFFFVRIMLPELVYTFIVSAILYIPLSKLIKHFYLEKEPKINFNIPAESE